MTDTVLPAAHPQIPTSEAPPQAVSCLHRILAVFVLWAFAVAEPVYDLLVHHTTFLFDSGIKQGRLWLVIAVLSLGLPLALSAAILLCRAIAPAVVAPAIGRWLFGGIQCLLWLMLGLTLTPGLPWYAGVPLTVLMAAVLIWSFERWLWLRYLMLTASLGIVLFPVMFASQPDIWRLAWPDPPPAAQSASTADPVRNPVPVVMVVLDEFSGTSLWDSAQKIDGRLFPNFAQLAKDARWYRNATTVHGETLAALPAVLSGRYPPERPDRRSPVQQNLFSMLVDEHGYDGLVLEPYTRMCITPRLSRAGTSEVHAVAWWELIRIVKLAYLHRLTPVDLKSRMPKLPKSWYGVNQRQADTSVTRGVASHPWDFGRDVQLRHFLNGLTPSATPTLYFLHVVFPHAPWHVDAAGRDYTTPGIHWDFPGPPAELWDIPERPVEMIGGPSRAVDFGVWPQDPLFTAQAQQRYVWQVQYADRFIGELRERLIATGLYDKCLLVVMADHGVSFRPGDRRRTATPSNQIDILSIPLFIKPPGARAGGVMDEPVESIDVLATIVDVLGISNPPSLDGTSLFSKPYKRRPSKRFVDRLGLRILPPDYPAKHPKRGWPVLSGDLPRTIARGVDPEHMTGRSVLEFTQGPPADGKIEWLPGTIPGCELEAGTTVYLAGLVGGAEAAPRPLTLALAFDGRIAAVTQTFAGPQIDSMFQFLLPADHHADKVARREIYLVQRAGDKTTLRRWTWPEP